MRCVARKEMLMLGLAPDLSRTPRERSKQQAIARLLVSASACCDWEAGSEWPPTDACTSAPPVRERGRHAIFLAQKEGRTHVFDGLRRPRCRGRHSHAATPPIAAKCADRLTAIVAVSVPRRVHLLMLLLLRWSCCSARIRHHSGLTDDVYFSKADVWFLPGDRASLLLFSSKPASLDVKLVL